MQRVVAVVVGGGVGVGEGDHSGARLNAAGCAGLRRGTRQMQRMRHWVCCVLVRGGGVGGEGEGGGVVVGAGGISVG